MVCFVTAGSVSAIQTFLNKGELYFEMMSLASVALVSIVGVSAAYTCYRAWCLYRGYGIELRGRLHGVKMS